MANIQIKSTYMVAQLEVGNLTFEARWPGRHYVYYYFEGKEVALAWQDGEVKDLDTLGEFAQSNLPYHIGFEDEEEAG